MGRACTALGALPETGIDGEAVEEKEEEGPGLVPKPRDRLMLPSLPPVRKEEVEEEAG